MASSSIRQPEDVFVSVASPLAPGASSVGRERRAEGSASCPSRHASPIATASDGGGNRAGEDEPAVAGAAVRTPPLRDARA